MCGRASAHDDMAVGRRQQAFDENASERTGAADDGDALGGFQGLIAPETAAAAGPDRSCSGPSGFFSVFTSRMVGVPDQSL